MKYTTISMLMVLAAVAAVGQSSGIDPSPIESNITSLAISYGSDDLPEEGSYEINLSEGLDISEAEADEGLSRSAGPRNIILFRSQYIRNAMANTVHIHNQTWRSSTAITLVRAWQVGPNQGATARITAGGVGFTYVTVQLRSVIGIGFNIIMEIYGW